MGRRPKIDLRIQRFTDGPPPGLMSAINIFDFAEGEPSIAFTRPTSRSLRSMTPIR
jgi:hypothetical protein